jgi:hypothetical protein
MGLLDPRWTHPPRRTHISGHRGPTLHGVGVVDPASKQGHPGKLIRQLILAERPWRKTLVQTPKREPWISGPLAWAWRGPWARRRN